MLARYWMSVEARAMVDEREFLASEVKTLLRFLEEIPEENILERMSLESRLENVRTELEGLPERRAVEKAQLTFSGSPVMGSRGISAEFGAKATGAFSALYSTVSAALFRDLSRVGPLPATGRPPLMITGVALGSFGFEFEVPESETPLLSKGSSDATMDLIESLLQLAVNGDDDEVADVVDLVHPRAVHKMNEFLDILIADQALCALQYGRNSFRFRSLEDVKRSRERLKTENIQESTEEFQGQFVGVLPDGRTFEFMVAGEQKPIKGRIDKAIDDPLEIGRNWLFKQATVTFHVIRFAKGGPRYSLREMSDIRIEDL